MSRWREVFTFEVALHLRRPTTWLCGLLLLGLSIVFMIGLGSDMGTHANAPASVALYTLILGFLGLLVTAALFGDAAHRDVETRMQALFYTTPLRKPEYLLGRFLGAFVANALVLAAVPVGLVVATFLPAYDPELVGPFALASYVRPYGLFLMPGLLINATFLFGLAAASRRTLPTYLGALALAGLYTAAVLVTGELMDRRIGAIIDPSGIVAVLELVRDWSPAERNAQQIPLDGRMLLNRLLWIAAGLAAFAVMYHRFRFAHHETADRRRAAVRDDEGRITHLPVTGAPMAATAFEARMRLHQAVAIGRRALWDVLESRDFRFVLVGAVLFAVIMSGEALGDSWGTPAWPVTSRLARFLASGIFGILFSLVIAFYAGELVWSERDARLADITDAAPVADWAPFVGRTAALCAVALILQAALMLGGVIAQALQGYHRFEPGLYLQILFGLKLVDYLIFAVVAMLVHAAVNQKAIGNIAAVAFYLATHFASRFGIRHNLLVFGSDAGWVHSDISGFDPHLPAYVWMKLYWVGWTLLLAVVASLVWVRGRELAVRDRARLARRRGSRRVALVAAGAALLVAGTGGFVYYNTNVLHTYRTPDEHDLVQVEYERRYKHLDDAPQPKVARVQLRAEHYPDRRRIDLQGRYVLVNRTAVPIDSVHVFLQPFYEPRSMGVDRPATTVLADAVHRMWIYALAQPLAPGDSVQLRFDLRYAPRGFPNEGINTAVVENGTFVERQVMPAIGYQRSWELEDPVERRQFGLPERKPVPPPTDLAARRDRESLIEYDAIIGTAPDQIVAATGPLRRSWLERGRRYFHYASRGEPMINNFGFLAARYAARDTVQDGVAITLLHHPAHAWNVDRILGAAARAVAYYGTNFGASPYRQIRIAEFPGYSRRATASPYLIAHSESFGFLARVDDEAGDLDTPLLVTAHEVGHFWWGGQIMPAPVLGGQVLTETLANYSAMMVLEHAHGRDAARRFQRIMHIEYLNRRGRGDQPLLTTGDHSNVHYRKGAVAMYALKEYLGEARVNAALRSFVAQFRFSGAPYPTSLDLYAELRAVTPDSLQYLLTDLLETMTIWDLRASEARAEPVGDGRYRVRLQVEAAKFRIDTLGGETRLPVDDLLEVAVFGAAPAGGRDEPLYVGKHWIRGDTATITVTVRGKPSRAGIDPYALLIARRGDDLADNAREVETGG